MSASRATFLNEHQALTYEMGDCPSASRAGKERWELSQQPQTCHHLWPKVEPPGCSFLFCDGVGKVGRTCHSSHLSVLVPSLGGLCSPMPSILCYCGNMGCLCTPMSNRNSETELEETEEVALIAKERTQQASSSRTAPPLEEVVRSLTVFKEQGVISSWTFS